MALEWSAPARKHMSQRIDWTGLRESGRHTRKCDAATLSMSTQTTFVNPWGWGDPTRLRRQWPGPDLGLLHVDDWLRESFVFDLLEPLRAKVNGRALELILKKGLRPFMFYEFRDGVVRLDPDFAQLLAQSLMPKLRGPAMELASQYVTQLRKVKVPYRLQRFGARTPSSEYDLVPATSCGYCKQLLHRKGLKFCSRQCYLRHSVEIRQPLKLAQARLAEMRSQGLNPGHGGEAAKARGAKIAVANGRRAMALSPEERRAKRAEQARVRRRAVRSSLAG